MKARINLPIMMLSLSISIMLWLYVYAQNLPSESSIYAATKISFPDDAQRQRWFADSWDKTVRLRLLASQDQIDAIKSEKPVANIDLSDPREGMNRYPVFLEPSSVENFLVDHRLFVYVTLERVDSKLVPVEVENKGMLKDQLLTLAGHKLFPQRVTVMGPRSQVAKVTHARGYLDLSVLEPNAPEPQAAPLAPLDRQGFVAPNVEVRPPDAVITPFVTALPAEKTVLVQPEFTGEPGPGFVPAGYRIKPSQVRLVGRSPALGSLTTAQTEAMDVSGLTSDKTFRVRLRLPVGTVSRSGPLVTVRYLVRPMSGSPSKSSSRASKSSPRKGAVSSGGL